jgi:hypothetical protein
MASFVRDSKFRHIKVEVSPRECYYEQLKITNSANDSNMVASNSKFLVYIDAGGGGYVQMK